MAKIDSSTITSSKRRRLDSTTNSLSSTNFQLDEETVSTAISSNSFSDHSSGDLPVSLSSTNDVSYVAKDCSLKELNLISKSLETESSTCLSDNKFREPETIAFSIMESPALVFGSRKRKSLEAVEMPSKAEIDEFLTVAEKVQKEERKRFTERYNYDIVQDLPLEGRYQWVRVEP